MHERQNAARPAHNSTRMPGVLHARRHGTKPEILPAENAEPSPPGNACLRLLERPGRQRTAYPDLSRTDRIGEFGAWQQVNRADAARRTNRTPKGRHIGQAQGQSAIFDQFPSSAERFPSNRPCAGRLTSPFPTVRLLIAQTSIPPGNFSLSRPEKFQCSCR